MAEQGTGHRQRLKERFLAGEPSARSDEALLELLLTYAIPRIDVQPLARSLVAQFGSLRAALAADRRDLASVHGLGDAAITLLKLADHLIGTRDSVPAPLITPDPFLIAASDEEVTINTEVPKAQRHGEDRSAESSAARSEERLEPSPAAAVDVRGPSTGHTPQWGGPRGRPRRRFHPATLPGGEFGGPVAIGSPPHQAKPVESAPGSAPDMPEARDIPVPVAPAVGAEPARASTPAPARSGAARTKREQEQPAPDAPPVTRWRATGRYSTANMLKPGMVTEIRLALDAYARLGDLAATRRYLQETELPQRSRATRNTIVTVIGERLVSWNPPRWVCADLMAAATDLAGLKLLLLLHTARQDTLLYAIIQEVVAPRRHAGLTAISYVEMQRFLDEAAPTHPEIHTWSRATRIKLAGNLLTVLRDYGLLTGTATKRIVEPVVSPFAAGHLARLLAAEGIAPEQIADHPDWALWLLTPERARALLAARDEGAP